MARLDFAAETVMAVGLITWLDNVAMEASVVAGVTRLALAFGTLAPATLVDTVPGTVPRVVTPKFREGLINEGTTPRLTTSL